MSPDEDQYEFLLQQLRQRIEEGQGETIYEIGLGGNLFTLTLLAPACLSVCKFSLYYPYKISCLVMRIKQMVILGNVSKRKNSILNLFTWKLYIEMV